MKNFTAVFCVLAGVILCYISYFLENNIITPVLTFCAQCLIYAGSIFGVSIYFDKINNERNK